MAPELQNSFSPEQTPVPEQLLEKKEVPIAAVEGQPVGQPVAAVRRPTIPTAKPVPAPAAADPMQKEIEAVLTENIAEIYKQLPQDRKTIFKQKGEALAVQITAMIKGGLMQIKKILKLIREWLLIIPGVNKFFLEQEAKIKTDKIQQLYEREHAAAL